ncbi:minor tail protein [Gordonia phage YorkOnyx]|uniref:Minor tail protein n=1 Tax=Gordonia phage YorkOnyx TaxID=2762402 RepID=A0A7G8LM90_9CAUD|nr:minor tail protein [Gordonia phage YorkOnyx]QNJ58362.1 hypothetical protein SEA_YORKONYX_41 [Gordonia phage YorkOnyx]
MIPGVRFRASRRRGGGVSLGFVQAVGVAGSNQAPSVDLTSAGGSASKFIIGTTSNSYGGLGVTMDGVALTPYGFVSATRVHQLFIVNAVAGAHTFVVDGGGSWETMIVAEYQGVTSVGPYTSKVSSSQVATHTGRVRRAGRRARRRCRRIGRVTELRRHPEVPADRSQQLAVNRARRVTNRAARYQRVRLGDVRWLRLAELAAGYPVGDRVAG